MGVGKKKRFLKTNVLKLVKCINLKIQDVEWIPNKLHSKPGMT